MKDTLPQGGNYKHGVYHVVVDGKSISTHSLKSEASSAASKYRKSNPSSQPRVKHESELTESIKSTIAASALAACVAASGCKVGNVDMGEPTEGSVSGKPHVTKVAQKAANDKKVTEAAKPNMRGVEAELKAHAQRKIDYEKENGPMVAHELFSHEQRRKQLLKNCHASVARRIKQNDPELTCSTALTRLWIINTL